MQRSQVITAIVATAVVATATVALASLGGAAGADDEPPTSEFTTMTVQQGDLSVDYEAEGSVSPSRTLDVGAPVDGTVVSTAELASEVTNGMVLAVIDDSPIVAITGETPMWRDLTVGDEGSDVLQLERALAEFGFNAEGDVTIDNEYTDATATMVRDWQESLGADSTGSVDRTSLVVISESMRLAAITADPGSLVLTGDPVLSLSSVEQVVAVTVPVADSVTLATDDSVTVRLPDRTELGGTVESLNVAGDASVRSVVIGLDEPDLVPSLDGVSVDVLWTHTVAENVPTVPADALRRVDAGWYVVDVLADDGTVTAVQVEPGAVVGGLAQVIGAPVGAVVVRP